MNESVVLQSDEANGASGEFQVKAREVIIQIAYSKLVGIKSEGQQRRAATEFVNPVIQCHIGMVVRESSRILIRNQS